MSLQYYHNPACSKSRQALVLLQDAGYTPDCIHYLKQTPDVDTVLALAQKLAVPVRQLVRDNEAAYAACVQLSDSDDLAWAQAIVAHPILLQRPILVTEHAAVVCRPPEIAVPWLVEQGHERT